ncbi:hypothetical protein AAMO2058_000883600 [Amorphochlora amoebiformis]
MTGSRQNLENRWLADSRFDGHGQGILEGWGERTRGLDFRFGLCEKPWVRVKRMSGEPMSENKDSSENLPEQHKPNPNTVGEEPTPRQWIPDINPAQLQSRMEMQRQAASRVLNQFKMLNGDIVEEEICIEEGELGGGGGGRAVRMGSIGSVVSDSKHIVEEEEWYIIGRNAIIKQNSYNRVVRQIASMLRPTASIILLVGLYVGLIGKKKKQEDKILYQKILFYQQTEQDSLGERMRGSMINAALVVAGIIGITFIFLILFSLKAKKVASGFLVVILGFLICAPWIYFSHEFFRVYAPFPLEALSFSMFIYNFTVCGLVALTFSRLRSSIFNKAYLIILCVSLVWPFTEFPELTVWCTLGLLTIYDLLAVLTPCGPLRFIMEREITAASTLPGLMYTGEFFRLGLGDFVFYGVLVARSMFLDSNTTLSCCLAVSMGLVLTIIITRSAKTLSAIPALPVSVVFGFVFYVLTPLVVNPYLERLTRPFY